MTATEVKCPLVPIDNKLVIQRDEEEDVTPGGIVLPDTAKEPKARGTVLAIGPGRLLDDGTRAKPQVLVGHKVIFARYSGAEIEEGDETYVLLAENEVLAIVRNA